MADPSPRQTLLHVRITAAEGDKPANVVWEGRVSPENLRRLTHAASDLIFAEVLDVGRHMEQELKGIVTELRDAVQDQALEAAKGLAKVALKQATKLRERQFGRRRR